MDEIQKQPTPFAIYKARSLALLLETLNGTKLNPNNRYAIEQAFTELEVAIEEAYTQELAAAEAENARLREALEAVCDADDLEIAHAHALSARYADAGGE